MEKTYMFQYAVGDRILEDTNLLTREEAYALVDKWLPDLIKKWDNCSSAEMCVWANCKSDVDYDVQEFDIDKRDCEFKNGHFYRIKEEKII